ncbi:MAG: hypothetical protein ACO27Q_10095 [Bacteroidia bacterium]
MIYFLGFQPMYCPYCINNEEYIKTKTVDTRQFINNDDEPYVERRHKCPECGEHFYTIETYHRPANISDTINQQNNTGVQHGI